MQNMFRKVQVVKMCVCARVRACMRPSVCEYRGYPKCELHHLEFQLGTYEGSTCSLTICHSFLRQLSVACLFFK